MSQTRSYARIAALVILATLGFRILILLLNPNGLHGDEAQYWAWSQTLAGGYYSKPPGIAWVIAASTALFGDAEWAVRLPSPILHAAAAAFLFGAGRRLLDERAGLMAAMLYLFMPGVALSSTLISTDAALLCALAGAIYAWVRVRETPSLGWAVGLGVAVGLAFMAKYAAIYLLPALIGATLLERKSRAALLGLRGGLAAIMAVLIVMPNIAWNASNDFATLSHTADNANMGDGPSWQWSELGEFLGGQLGVFGPLSFVLLIIALVALIRSRAPLMPWLALIVVVPLVLISGQALLSRANANWAAAAYSAAPLLIAAWAVSSRGRSLAVWAAVALNLIIGTVPAAVMTSPTLTDRLGFANAVKRQRGWPETVQAVRAAFAAGDYDVVAVDHRLSFYDLRYYGLEDTMPLRMWRYEPGLSNHAELTDPLTQNDGRVLIVSYYRNYVGYFATDFDRVEPVGTIDIPLGGDKRRTYWLYEATGYNGPRER